MRKMLAAIACSLLVATAVPMSTADEIPDPVALHQQFLAQSGNPLPGPVPTAPLGNDLGCDESNAWYFAYGMPGTPAGPCNTWALYDMDITHGFVDCAAYCFAVAFGYESVPPYGYGYFQAFCPTGGTGIIDWTTGEAIWLSGDCELAMWENPSDYPLYTYGYGEQGAKFSFTDNLADAALKLVL